MKNYRKSLILSVVVLCVLTACSEEKKQTSVRGKTSGPSRNRECAIGRPDAGIYRYCRGQCGKQYISFDGIAYR